MSDFQVPAVNFSRCTSSHIHERGSDSGWIHELFSKRDIVDGRNPAPVDR